MKSANLTQSQCTDNVLSTSPRTDPIAPDARQDNHHSVSPLKGDGLPLSHRGGTERERESVGDINSSPLLLKSGVPHGSVLGSIFFTLYTQPASDKLREHYISNQKFADNTQPNLLNFNV